MEIKQRKLVNRELLAVAMEEKKLRSAALKAKPALWKKELEKKIPPKVYDGLEAAFSTGFSLVFRQGRRIIELTYNKKNIQQQFGQHSSEGGKSDLKKMHKSVKKANGLNLTATTAEGIALGALGVGMPDIVLFLSTLLKGIYETALHYGFDYESRQEQYLILTMMATALTGGTLWDMRNAEVDSLLTDEPIHVTEDALKTRIQKTASIFAMDMLLLKFIQGTPVVGILGGAANPVYYNKIMRYVQLKYKKRYLQQLRSRLSQTPETEETC